MTVQFVKPDQSFPWIIAHRGSSFDYPENTAPALSAAMKLPVQAVEFDVQITADGVPILYHDRTTAKLGMRNQRVHNLTWAALRGRDAGRWKASAFEGTKLLTLAQTLKKYTGRKLLLVEIKVRRDAKADPEWMAAQTVEQIAKLKCQQQVAILSFSPDILEAVHALDHRLRCVLNLKKRPLRIADWRERFDYLAGVCIKRTQLNRNFVSAMHDWNKPVLCYTCNSIQTTRKALATGVDGLISDRPDWLAETLPRLIQELKREA